MKKLFYLLFLLPVLFAQNNVFAAVPSGTDTFQLLASPFTGSDNSGDGGTGLPTDLNYYYVGQSFSTQIEIKSGGTTASNIWIDYLSDLVTANILSTGTYFNVWSGQVISATDHGANGGRVYSTGAQIPVAAQGGVGNFGSVTWKTLVPTEANYGRNNPTTLDVNIGVIGDTTESNISNAGVDLLDDAEDFKMHIWADTKKPYVQNPYPVSGSVGVAVDLNYSFDLLDSLNGDGDDSGVGTGINLSSAGSAIFTNGTNIQNLTNFISYNCSGVWGTNLCLANVDPPSPSGIAGDIRNWEYNTLYTVDIAGYQDLASSAQSQKGDINGPNTMITKQFTFRTEGDTSPPQVVSESPQRGSAGNSASTNVVVNVEDRKTYPTGASGLGVDVNTCKISISSPSFSLQVYSAASSEVNILQTDYGYQYTINPIADFGEIETVSVTVSDCADLAGNVMTSDNYNFITNDILGPYIDNRIPENDTSVNAGDNISFHIKDTGAGVDLSSVVIYMNGSYYTNGGGAGSVTVSGTRITFAESFDFNGSNYVSDNTALSGSSNDYQFILDPQNDFIAGESIPILVYAKDVSGNIMERYVYGVSLSGGSCTSGVAYCGVNTSWNGSSCVGTGGGGGDIVVNPINLEISNIAISQIDQESVLVSWMTTSKADSQVIYGLNEVKNISSEPKYGYDFITSVASSDSIYHSVVVDGLSAGNVYYFRPVSKNNVNSVVGDELAMTPKFSTLYIEKYISKSTDFTCFVPKENEQQVSEPIVDNATDSCLNSEEYYDYKKPLLFNLESGVKDKTRVKNDILQLGRLKIVNIIQRVDSVNVSGIGVPNSRISIKIDD